MYTLPLLIEKPVTKEKQLFVTIRVILVYIEYAYD